MTKKTRPNKIWGTLLNVIGMMIWVGVSIIAAQLAVGYLMVLTLGADRFSQPVWTTVYSAVAYLLAMCLIILVPASIKKRKTSRDELGLRELPTWQDIGLAPAGFIVYLILAMIVTALFSLFPWFDAEQAQDVGFNTYIFGFDRIVAFVTLVVIAPIAEEIIFRGWLYEKIRHKFSEVTSQKIAVVISIFLVSLLFGIVHWQWNVGVNVFAMSVVLCSLREITGTIYAGIILHMLKNGVAFYLLYVVGMV